MKRGCALHNVIVVRNWLEVSVVPSDQPLAWTPNRDQCHIVAPVRSTNNQKSIEKPVIIVQCWCMNLRERHFREKGRLIGEHTCWESCQAGSGSDRARPASPSMPMPCMRTNPGTRHYSERRRMHRQQAGGR